MSRVARRMPRNLDVIADPVLLARYRVIFSFEERLLEVPTRTPRQDLPDLPIPTDQMTLHVRRKHPLGWSIVVCAAGCVNMVIAGIPAELRRINPSLESKRQTSRGCVRHLCKAWVRLRYSGPREYSIVYLPGGNAMDSPSAR